MRTIQAGAALVVLLPSLALASAPEVDEPDNLPPPAQPQPSDSDGAATEVSSSPSSYRKSITLEAALGLGMVLSTSDSVDSGVGLAGIDLGIGGFVNPKLAITGRISGVLTRGQNSASLIFAGASAQYWLDDKLWGGGGIGLAYLDAATNYNGFAFDVRAGYTFWQTREHAFHGSIEITPSVLEGSLLVGIAVLVGYQYL